MNGMKLKYEMYEKIIKEYEIFIHIAFLTKLLNF